MPLCTRLGLFVPPGSSSCSMASASRLLAALEMDAAEPLRARWPGPPLTGETLPERPLMGLTRPLLRAAELLPGRQELAWEVRGAAWTWPAPARLCEALDGERDDDAAAGPG